MCLATYSCPHDLLIEKLEETLAEVQERKPDEKNNFRARVLLAGSELDSPELVKLAEEAGAYVRRTVSVSAPSQSGSLCF